MKSIRGALIGGAALSILFFFPLGSLVLGILAWVVGKHDLGKISANEADESGVILVKFGYGLGVAAALIGGVVTLIVLIKSLFFDSVFKAIFEKLFSIF